MCNGSTLMLVELLRHRLHWVTEFFCPLRCLHCALCCAPAWTPAAPLLATYHPELRCSPSACNLRSPAPPLRRFPPLQLSASLAAAEALARCSPPAVPTLAATLLCGTAAAVLGLETLKRALAPANRSRDLLVGACMGAGLPQVLLQRLDWRSRERAGAEGEEVSCLMLAL